MQDQAESPVAALIAELGLDRMSATELRDKCATMDWLLADLAIRAKRPLPTIYKMARGSRAVDGALAGWLRLMHALLDHRAERAQQVSELLCAIGAEPMDDVEFKRLRKALRWSRPRVVELSGMSADPADRYFRGWLRAVHIMLG